MINHHSRRDEYRSPSGAVCCGCKMTLRLKTGSGTSGAALWLCLPDSERMIPMELMEEKDGCRTWECVFTAPDRPGLLFYRFALDERGEPRFCCAPSDGFGGEGEIRREPGTPWQITVCRDQTVPEWLRNGICYQVFPDRFYRGEPEKTETRMHPGSLLHVDWEDDPVYIRDKRGDIVAWDFFGGDLEGVRMKLGYLASLHVSVLYLNPIFLSFSNHRYDTADYREVDPLLGGEDALRTLCREAKSMGIRILLDGVFSHTGSSSRYFNRDGRFEGLGAYQSKESPYYEWYDFRRYPDDYDCWWGVKSMPNVREMTPAYVRYQLTDEDSTVRRWMRCGISGWRLDVADELPDRFLQILRRVVLEENPEAVLLGEVWEDASNKISYDTRRAYLWGEELDSVTNYPFRDSLLDFLLGRIDASLFARRLESQRENYPEAIFYSLMNMTGTHDTARLMSLLGGIPARMPADEEDKKSLKLSEDEKELARSRLALYALIAYTHPGMPTVYYGDETGMEGLEDPWNRRTYPWGREDADLIGCFRGLGELRMDHSALRTGSWTPIALGRVYGCLREDPEGSFLMLANPDAADRTACVSSSDSWKDLESGEVFVPEDGIVNVPMGPVSGRIMVRTV